MQLSIRSMLVLVLYIALQMAICVIMPVQYGSLIAAIAFLAMLCIVSSLALYTTERITRTLCIGMLIPCAVYLVDQHGIIDKILEHWPRFYLSSPPLTADDSLDPADPFANPFASDPTMNFTSRLAVVQLIALGSGLIFTAVHMACKPVQPGMALNAPTHMNDLD